MRRSIFCASSFSLSASRSPTYSPSAFSVHRLFSIWSSFSSMIESARRRMFFVER